MSQNTSTTSVNNEINNFLTQNNIEQEMNEIQSQQQIFSDIFEEILGINVQALEEKQSKVQMIKKIKKHLRQASKLLRKGNKIRRDALYPKIYSNIQIKSNKQDDYYIDYLDVPLYYGNQQEGQQETLEIQDDLFAFPLYLDCYQSQSKKVNKNKDRNFFLLKKKSKKLSRSSKSIMLN